MNIGEKIIIGKVGNQSMPITDPNVSPQHAVLKKTGEDLYQIEDNDSTKGIYIFGMRIKRKTINGETPIVLGTLKTTVNQLLQGDLNIDLESVWNNYDSEKKKWDRLTMMVAFCRYLPSLITMIVVFCLGHDLSETNRLIITVSLTLLVLIISMIASDKVASKKSLRLAELNSELKKIYVCPHCHSFLGLTPYEILKKEIYCPNRLCGKPLK